MTKGTIQNRESFLNHIRDCLGGAPRTEIERPAWEFQPQREVYQDKTAKELLQLFKESSIEKDTHVIETTMEQLVNSLKHVMETYEGTPMIATKDKRFDDCGLTNLLKNEDVYVWNADAGEEKNIAAAKKANIGFFFSDVSLAESGTVTQFNDRDNARVVSLLPTTYAAIVPASTIVPRMTQATDILHGKVQKGDDISPYVNFISGPSNSADIEMNIVKGVHGPVQAVHIIVTDA